MEQIPSVIYLNGALVDSDQARISPLDRGFALGDGLFETLLVENGSVFRLAQHLARLREGLDRLYITAAVEDHEMEEGIRAVLAGNGLRCASVRITISRGVPAERGLLPGTVVSGPTIVIQAAPFTGYPTAKYRSGFAAVIATVRRNETSPTACHKTCNYLDNIVARIEAAQGDADEAIMLNSSDFVACGSASNIFAIHGGRILTPSLRAGILAGITRAAIIELARAGGLEICETDLTVDDLRDGDEAFLTNSLMGVMPLTRLAGSPIGNGAPGPTTGLLRASYEALVSAETGKSPS